MRAISDLPWDQVTVVLTLALFPATLLAQQAVPANPIGPEATLANSIWLLVFASGIISMLTRHPRMRAIQSLAPYVLFMFMAVLSLTWTDDLREGLGLAVRLITPALVYLAAWSTAGKTRLQQLMPRLAMWWIPTAAVAYLLFGFAELVPSFEFPERLVALSLVALFPIATSAKMPWQTAVLLGAVALATAVGSGSRMASLALAVMVLISPAVAVSLPWRALAALGAVALFTLLLAIPAFQERWFTSDEPGSLADIIRLEGNLDTSGRREVWGALAEECRASWLTGRGMGSANTLSVAVSSGFPQPHNEYLRLYCDHGVPVTMVFMTFFVAVGWRAVRVGSARPAGKASAMAALQLVVGLALLSVTDNPLTATLAFMAPAAVIFAWSDHLYWATRSLLGDKTS